MAFNYSHTFFLSLLILIMFLPDCKEKDDAAVERNMVIENLTGNASKRWKTHSLYIDETQRVLTKCDSTHILILSNDFSWEEFYNSFQCVGYYDGTWTLNDANNVIEISYFDPYQFKTVLQKFEIMELNENVFTYRTVISNLFKTVKLVPFEE